MPEINDDVLPKLAGAAAEVEARPAASVIVLRGDPFEVLFLRRSSASTFVPDAWIFPGGAVDDVDRRLTASREGDEATTMRLCAARELYEEAGIWIGPPLPDPERWRARLLDDCDAFEEICRLAPPELDRLVPTSRWVTPTGVPKRYDTWFFLLAAGDDAEATAEEREGMEVRWLRPHDALQAQLDGSFQMVFPTIRNLEAIAPFPSREALLAARRGAEIPTTRPRLVVEGGRKRIILPGEE